MDHDTLLSYLPRFEASIADEGDCWIWTRAKYGSGYGYIRLREKVDGRASIVAHRYSYLLHVGEYDDANLDLDHLCRNRTCVNAWHLEPVTRWVNLDRSPHANQHKVRCPQDHEYTPENTYLDPRGSRFCRTCSRERKATARRRKALGISACKPGPKPGYSASDRAYQYAR